jgi:predicted nucleic acid-binding protein
VLIVDTGPLYAAADVSDRNHARCVELLNGVTQPLQVPALVAAEIAYLTNKRLGARAELTFGASFVQGELFLEPVEPADWRRITELMETYIDMPLGMVDASIVALAERLNARRIATLDHRHFAPVRPRHVENFELVP